MSPRSRWGGGSSLTSAVYFLKKRKKETAAELCQLHVTPLSSEKMDIRMRTSTPETAAASLPPPTPGPSHCPLAADRWEKTCGALRALHPLHSSADEHHRSCIPDIILLDGAIAPSLPPPKKPKLYYGCRGSAQGRARSLQTNTVTTSLQLFQPHQPAASARYPSPSARWCRLLTSSEPPPEPRRWLCGEGTKKMLVSVPLPSHTGDAKHPAGLQRDPAKMRQVGESVGATSAKFTFRSKSGYVVSFGSEVHDVI